LEGHCRRAGASVIYKRDNRHEFSKSSAAKRSPLGPARNYLESCNIKFDAAAFVLYGKIFIIRCKATLANCPNHGAFSFETNAVKEEQWV
jgi:hypothetical protein